MNRLTKNLSSREKTLLVVFSLAILGMLYFLLVDRPVRQGMTSAVAQCQDLQTEIDALHLRVAEIKRMQKELKSMQKGSANVSEMPSYNASRQEVDFLNSTLSQAQDYYIGFNEVTRDSDLIRRNFSLQYKTASYQEAVDIIYRLEHSWIRCLIGDVTTSSAEDDGNIKNGSVQVNCTATFYETMYDGKEDPELPQDSSNSDSGAAGLQNDLDEVLPEGY